MTPIQTNKPVFFDDEGSALEGGQIYIGQPSTDPRTNPKTVTFRDSGGATFTASQPLKTVAGRISYNGKPIVALVDGEYSMLILDASGKQLDYSRSVNAAGTEGGGIADFSEVTRVGLTLPEIKAFDSAVGDVIRNIGKVTATDNDGKDWLVVSATGTPGDDDTLIDLDNGLQGSAINTYVRVFDLDPSLIAADIKDGSFDPSGPTQVWTGSTTTGVPMSALSESGPGMYVIVDDSAESYWLYVVDLATDSSSGIVFFAGTIGRQGSFRRTDDTFLLFEYNTDTGAFIANRTITAIYKV